MATFALGHNARLVLARRVPAGHATTSPSPTKITWYVDPSDTLTLRGIPALGRGVGGAIRGTRPDLQT